MVSTIKFSQFLAGGDLAPGDSTAGLQGGANALFTNPWTFLAPGTTGDRPAPSAAIDYRLRFNTTLEVYEYYDPIAMVWTELSGSGTGTVNPGSVNDLAYYPAAGTALSPITAAANSVLVTDGSDVPSLSTTLPSGLTIPGYQPSITAAALTEVNDTNVTMTLGGTPSTALLESVSMTLGWTGLLAITRGGTGVGSVTTTPTATAFSGWDANKNLSANAFIQGYTTTATSAGTTVLTVGSTWQQYFTGTTTQTVVLPDTSTLVEGQSLYVINNSTGSITVQSHATDTVQVMTSNTDALYTCISTVDNTSGGWNTNYVYDAFGVTSITGTANQVIASASTGNITLSLPQSIATTSSPTFNNLTLTNPLGVGDGGTGLSTIAAQKLLYGASAGVIGQLGTANDSILVTDGSGNPSFSTTLPSGISITGYALTKVNDTNVTLTLGGSPSTALLASTGITAGWTGVLSGLRGGTGVDNSGLTISLADATEGYVLTSDSSGNATWQIASASGSITQVDGDTGSVTPTDGVITISGGSTGLTTSGSSSTLNLTGVLGLAYGGTNHNLTASAGGVVWSDASKLNILSGTSTANQLLLSGDAATPAWSTSTYPATNAANTLLYASSANTMAALATADNGVLITSNSGVPSWLANSGTPGYVLTANSGAPPSWQNIQADGAVTEIATDSGNATPSSGTITISGGSSGLTTSASSSTVDITGTLKLANGGTNADLTASDGGIFYSTATAGAILAGTATANQVLLSGSSSTPAWSTATYPATTTVNQVLYSSSANVISGISAVDSAVMISSSGGVPSFSTTLPSGLTIPGYQPTITGAALTEANDTNVTLSLSGTPASALLEAVEITAGWTGTLSLARGGSAADLTAVAGGIVYSTASAMAFTAAGSSGQILLSQGTSEPIWTTSTYPATNAVNTLLYASSANVMAALATANSSVLVTSSGGVPSLSTTLPSGISATNMHLTTPEMNVINDTNGNEVLLLQPIASAVNYLEIQNAATGGNVILEALGSDTNILLQLIGKGSSGVEIQGTANASGGAAGYVGEVISSTIATGSAVSISNNSAKDLTSISLTAGDWDVYGHVTILGSTSNLTVGACWCSLSSATLPDGSLYSGMGSGASAFVAPNAPFLRVNVSSTTNVYVSAYASFAAGTASMSGSIFARRAR